MLTERLKQHCNHIYISKDGKNHMAERSKGSQPHC